MKTGKNLGVYSLAVLIVSLSSLLSSERAMGQCGCMDIALVVDDSGSMGGAIDNVKAELPAIVTAAQFASGGDLRMGLVSFPGVGLTADGILVRQELTSNITAVENAIQALTAVGGAGVAEPSDVALEFAVTGSTEPSCVISNPPFGTYRPQCLKIAVLITDAPPGECDDVFTPGVSDVKAHEVAVEAANAGVLVSSVYVPTFAEEPTTKAIMEDYADVTGGIFVETAEDGSGTAEGILDIIASCGGLSSTQCVTRNSQFWFTHAFSNDSSESNCVALLRALTANGGIVNLGFLRLPVTFENSDNVVDVFDATMEAVGFKWRSTNLTGEDGNQQSLKLRGSKLCKARKKLSVELIAATANVRLLGTQPGNCTYSNGGTVTNFPSDLLQLARTVASGNDPIACNQMTVLLRKFNNSGSNNNFPGNLVECSANDRKSLKSIARDPTSQFTCPGLNDNCASAQEVYFQAKNPPFSKAKFKANAGLPKYARNRAWWSISLPTAAGGRGFTAKASGNFQPVLRIFSGTCTATRTNEPDSGLTLVTLTQGSNLFAEVNFTTDGTNTYFIEARPDSTAIPGKLKLTVTSP
jgi:hypothetical protein